MLEFEAAQKIKTLEENHKMEMEALIKVPEFNTLLIKNIKNFII